MTPITRQLAGDMIYEQYGDWSMDDPEWWEEMIEILMEFGTVEAAREWLYDP